MLIDFIILITNITVVISAISRPVSNPVNLAYMGSVGKSIVDFYGMSSYSCKRKKRKRRFFFALREKTKNKSCVKLEFETAMGLSLRNPQTCFRQSPVAIVGKFMKECKICGINHGHLSRWSPPTPPLAKRPSQRESQFLLGAPSSHP